MQNTILDLDSIYLKTGFLFDPAVLLTIQIKINILEEAIIP